jgi:hypothetical protein
MVLPALPVLESLCAAAQGELTINQLAKTLRKSYGYTNAHVHALKKQGILQTREVGSALLCSINYASEESIGLLALASIRKKRSYLDGLTAKERAAIMRVLQSASPAIRMAYQHKRTITIIADAPVEGIAQSLHAATPSLPLRVVRTEDAEKELRALDITHTVILQHHEAFWTAIARQRSS